MLLQIGENGHGKNGVPYDLKDIYEDMEGVKNMIQDLYNVIKVIYHNIIMFAHFMRKTFMTVK